jgi:molybdopterin synthase catalytic subunit
VKSLGLITDSKIDLDSLLKQTDDPELGAVVVFIGKVRSSSEVGRVDGMTYDAYVDMAEDRMREVEENIKRSLPNVKIAMRHRIGKLGVGEVSVIVVASSPKRAAAFDACRMGIEEIKRRVPIWKKEHMADGSGRWVESDLNGAKKSRRRRS